MEVCLCACVCECLTTKTEHKGRVPVDVFESVTTDLSD